MKRVVLTTLTILIVSIHLFSSIDFTDADDLYYMDNISQCEQLLESQLSTVSSDEDKCEIYWRLSRNKVSLGDNSEGNDEKLKLYEKGLDLALKSIEIKDNPMAHLWKASNIGRIGQTKGILKSLSAAENMRSDLRIILDDFSALDSSETWYVLGTLYTSVPGGFISFGNKNYGISYYRIAVDTIPDKVIYPNHYKALALALYNRNWDKNKRAKEFKQLYVNWNKTTKPYDKYAFYEGYKKGENIPYYSLVSLNEMTDRQEAVMLLNYAIAKYSVWPYHSKSEQEAIIEIKDLKSQWT